MICCDNCGTKIRSDGVCPNCNEETLILEQYAENGMMAPDTIVQIAESHTTEIERRRAYIESRSKDLKKNRFDL